MAEKVLGERDSCVNFVRLSMLWLLFGGQQERRGEELCKLQSHPGAWVELLPWQYSISLQSKTVAK